MSYTTEKAIKRLNKEREEEEAEREAMENLLCDENIDKES